MFFYREKLEQQLLTNIQRALEPLEKLLEEISSHWGYEDRMYRFYYQSFKVYWIQGITVMIVEALEQLAPEGCTLCNLFQTIIQEGTEHTFEFEHNKNWMEHTRPMVEAFLHSKYFLEMIVKYGKTYTEAPQLMDSGWAALLCLYGLR